MPAASSHYLTLGIRPPTDAEKAGDTTDDTTRIEIFDITTTGFNYGACQQALTELDSDSPSLGNLKTYVDDCMGYVNGNPQSLEASSMGAFNHSLQECWYYNKHGDWQSGSGTVNSMKNDCEKIYQAGVDPETITWDDTGYVCYGQYGPTDPYDGYVGRCWEPAADSSELECADRACTCRSRLPGRLKLCLNGYVHYCSGNYNANQDTCNKDWVVKQDCDRRG